MIGPLGAPGVAYTRGAVEWLLDHHPDKQLRGLPLEVPFPVDDEMRYILGK